MATLINEAFVPVGVNMMFEGPGSDPEGRRIVEKYRRPDWDPIHPPSLLIFSPERELLGRLPWHAGAPEMVAEFHKVLADRPELAPNEDVLSKHAYDLDDPKQAALAKLEDRWDAGERAELVVPFETWLARYEDKWRHGAATALTLLGAARYHAGDFTGADIAWRTVIEKYPEHPMRRRASFNLLDPTVWRAFVHPDLAGANHPKASVERRIFVPNEAVRAENRRRVSSDSRYTTRQSGLPLVKIPAGTFTMGGQPPVFQRELPLRRVTISRPFYMSAWPVTQGLWRQFRPDDLPDPDSPLVDEIPVLRVSREEALAFCEFLSSVDGLNYRLPTEAEWEYAARGGLEGAAYPWGDSPPDETRCNYKYDQGVPVASYPPNGYGLFDMVGNVQEWTADLFVENAYELTPYEVTDPYVNAKHTGVSADPRTLYVVRGGHIGMNFSQNMMRNAIRLIHSMAGLRLVADIPSS